MELIKVNPTDFGLTDETAQNIKDQFLPMLNKMTELETKFNEVVQMPIDSPQASKSAKELRKEYVVVRKATEDIHKKQKAFYLNGGRYVDGWKNAQLFASQGKEERLKEIENYAENLEKQRIQELHEQRLEAIKIYMDDTDGLNFGVMQSDVWDAYFSTKKKQYEERLEAEKIAEQIRQKELAIRNLHEKRKSELLDFWSFIDAEVKEMNFGTWTDKYYNGMLTDLRGRKQQHDSEQQRLRAENEAMQEKLRLEREEHARKQAEFEELQRQQVERERALEQEKIKAEKEAKKLAKAPIKKQLMVWVNGFDIPDRPCEDQVAIDIETKFEAFKKWALQQVENL